MYILYPLQNVFTTSYNQETGMVESTLTLKLGKEPLPILASTSWWCQVEYSILDDTDVLTVVGDPVPLHYKVRK